MYTSENGRKIPLRDVQDLKKIRKERISVYDETGERILKNVDKSIVQQKMIGDSSMGLFGKVKKSVGRKLDERSREKTLKKKVEYNELKRSERSKAEIYRRKGLTEEEAKFMAEREVKRDVETKKKADRQARIQKATAALNDAGKVNRPPEAVKKKKVARKTKGAVKRVQRSVKEDIPNPNKLGFKI